MDAVVALTAPPRGAPSWRALMAQAGALATFLGPAAASRKLVPSLLWLPNDPAWRTRAAFFAHLPALAAGSVRLQRS